MLRGKPMGSERSTSLVNTMSVGTPIVRTLNEQMQDVLDLAEKLHHRVNIIFGRLFGGLPAKDEVTTAPVMFADKIAYLTEIHVEMEAQIDSILERL